MVYVRNIISSGSYISFYFCSEQDFDLPGTSLVFPSGSTISSEQCQLITIVNDGVREDTEEFSITLSSQDPDVVLQPNTTQVLIIDNDSEQKQPQLSAYISFSFL